MTDNRLRTRIACVLAGITTNNAPHPEYLDLADEVIEELGLQQEECDVRPGWEGKTFTRYATEWETTDE